MTIECVMNISEGRDLSFLSGLSEIIKEIPGSFLLSCSSDQDHHRSVFTFAGDAEAVLQAAWEACRESASKLDIRRHVGAHPRIGVIDVVPFVPLRNAGLAECARLAHLLGNKIGADLKIPVFMYGAAARIPERENLAEIRRGGLEGAAGRIREIPPDYGPARLHPTAGASVVGARKILIAFNIELASENLEAARDIARRIRESSGGLPCVKALGLFLESKNRVQVSMNLTDFRRTSVMDVFETVSALAGEKNIEIVQSEIIGHLPREALDEEDAGYLRLVDFEPSEIYIEDCLERRINESRQQR